ncbi:helix-turn-helix domain-containing protein [Streptomyces capparidis]
MLLRLSALDADAAAAVRVIAHFEALLAAGALDPAVLVRSTAGLAECPAGLAAGDGRTVRCGPDGTALAGGPGRVSGSADFGAGGRVWLERPGGPGPLDELVLEWMAIAATAAGGAPGPAAAPHLADPALVELVLSEREAVQDRARALRLLGLAPGLPLRAVAVADGSPAGAGARAVALAGRGGLAGTVRVAGLGSLGAVLVQRGDGAASPAEELRAALRDRAGGAGAGAGGFGAVRVGVGGAVEPSAAAESWAQAASALRFAAADGTAEAVVDHDELGPVALLAEIPVAQLRAQPDVRALRKLADGRDGGPHLAALAAFCRTGSLRQAAAELHLHHSSVAARLAHVEEVLGWRLRDPRDRFHAQLALYARRLAEAP